MNFYKFLLIFAVLFLILNSVVFAADSNIGCGGALKGYKYPWCVDNVQGLGGSQGLVAKFYGYALIFVGVTALGAIVYGGILWTVSAGNSGQKEEALKWIKGAIAGLVLLLAAYLLLNTINSELVKLKISLPTSSSTSSSSSSSTSTSTSSSVSTSTQSESESDYEISY